ncbi:MAG: lysophospholipase [Caulobacteraceae bacterium]|nr:lysophospholipase [Caulobacteraceae bacterium]
MSRRLALVFCLLALGCTRSEGRSALIDSRIPPALSPRFYPPPGWTFGLIRAGKAPAQRYGVSAPVGLAPRGQVLILTDYGESAEAWYETIRQLNGQGWTVWLLERLAQGGSARYSDRRDLGHAVSLDPDIAAVSGMIHQVIRPTDGVVIVGQGEGALVGLRASQRGVPVRGMVLTSPLLAIPPETHLHARLRFFGLGGLRADRNSAWMRDGPDAAQRGLTHDRTRGGVEKAWQQVNPDLRMGGPSLSRVAAVRVAVTGLRPAGLKPPALMLEDDEAGAELCRHMTQCEHRRLDGGPAFYLETDSRRQTWLEAVERFLSDRAADHPPALG